MNPIMKLRSDPYQIFRHSKTPVGLYARKKWLGQPHDSSYENDFQETVRFLLAGQSPDGSWENSFIITIQRLFWLHLTVRDEIEPVRKAIKWLSEQTLTFYRSKIFYLAEKISEKALAGLPFTKGSAVVLISSATLFLSSVFGRMENPSLATVYQWLQHEGSKGSGRWCGWASYSNMLRAFVVHPHYAKSRVVELAVKNLRRVQNKTGLWARGVPFYQTVNALAHLDSPEGDAQLVLAFRHLHDSQRQDGTWSISQPEWNTFLVIHALKNKDEL